MLNSGQVCAAYTRFYVNKKREAEFVEKMAAGVSGMKLGAGMDPRTQLGPLVSQNTSTTSNGWSRSAVPRARNS